MDVKKQKKSGRTTPKKVKKPSLLTATEIMGGVSSLASAICVHHSRISVWLYSNVKIPAEHVIKISQVTKGGVRPEELRPDINWEIPNKPDK
jgi:DNA-binding transcriptional regulator YdaS (Cro superfamily)